MAVKVDEDLKNYLNQVEMEDSDFDEEQCVYNYSDV